MKILMMIIGFIILAACYPMFLLSKLKGNREKFIDYIK